MALLALAAAPAGAEERVPEVSSSTGGLQIDDLGAADESITVGFAQSGLRWLVISTTGLHLSRGSNCDPPVLDSASGRFQTTCVRSVPLQASPTSVTVSLDSGDDTLTTVGLSSAISIHAIGRGGDDHLGGGPGPDELEGGLGRDILDGNEGDDSLGAGPDDDTLVGDGGRDLLVGDDGDDRLLDGDETTAAPEARDDRQRGGAGGDTLRIGLGGDSADAGSGDDTIFDDDGPVIADEIFPDTGVDLLSYRNFAGVSAQTGVITGFTAPSGSAPQELEGIEGTAKDDRITVSGSGTRPVTLIGLAGRDVLRSGAGPDLLIGGGGQDDLRSAGGEDVVDAKSGEATSDDPDSLVDLVFCGAGTDTEIADLTDPLFHDRSDGCENVQQSAIGEGPHVRLGGGRVTLSGPTLSVPASCPRALHHPCRGRIVSAGSLPGLDRARATRYRLGRGERGVIELRAGPGVTSGRPAFVESVEHGDVKGDKTTRMLVRVARHPRR